MDVKGIVNVLINGGKKVYEAGSEAAVWTGHKVVSFCKYYLVPGVKAAWNYTLPYIVGFFTFLRTGYGFAGIGIGLAVAMNKLGDKFFPGPENAKSRLVINMFAVGLLVGSGWVAGAYGLYRL